MPCARTHAKCDLWCSMIHRVLVKQGAFWAQEVEKRISEASEAQQETETETETEEEIEVAEASAEETEETTE